MFVDDIKLYASTERNLKSLVHITEKFSNDVGLCFGLSKCATTATKKGKLHTTNPIETEEGRIEVLKEAYKYLGIAQNQTIDVKQTKDALSNEYLKRVKNITSSHLSAKNTIIAINMFAIPSVSYGAACLNWTEEELRSIDIKTRKLLIENGHLHKNSCTSRIYIKRKDGGRGFFSA